MWSLTSPHAKRISGPQKFRPSPKNDYPPNSGHSIDADSASSRSRTIHQCSGGSFLSAEAPPTLDAGCYDGTRVSFFSTVRALAHGGRNHARSVRARDQDPEPIGGGSRAPNELTLPMPSKPDPCLIALVTILARQAVRDFIQAGWDGQEKCGLPDQGGF
jgi:hypothetical protein